MKIGSLLGVIAIGVLIGWKASVVKANFGQAWTPQGFTLAATRALSGHSIRNAGGAYAARKLELCTRRTPGTTSPSPPARSVIRLETFLSRLLWEPSS